VVHAGGDELLSPMVGEPSDVVFLDEMDVIRISYYPNIIGKNWCNPKEGGYQYYKVNFHICFPHTLASPCALLSIAMKLECAKYVLKQTKPRELVPAS
ncbi:MAG: hypothetical protein VXV91_04110, partial [Verrucomicrobiota bacterium]|nr:hypothetical protein [Verrucomicrobiota bacterium]MEC7236096.1 hypothetical protein [Verrucomicrobiota bacterium]